MERDGEENFNYDNPMMGQSSYIYMLDVIFKWEMDLFRHQIMCVYKYFLVNDNPN